MKKGIIIIRKTRIFNDKVYWFFLEKYVLIDFVTIVYDVKDDRKICLLFYTAIYLFFPKIMKIKVR